nr:hypothetical protein [Tanacetum cinerariifolium]
MSDSKHSTVTYTSISSDDGSLDVGSLGVIVLGYDGLPMMPKDPYAYVEDDVLPAEEQPLPNVVSPTSDSPGYITEDDVDEEESSEDDDDDEEANEGGDEKEEEKYQAPANFFPPPAYRTTTRMPIRAQKPIPFPSETEIPSPPLPTRLPDAGAPLGYRAAMIRLRAESPFTSHPLSLPPPIVLPHTRASMVMMRVAAPSNYILAPRSGILTLGTPPSKWLCIALGPRFKVRECSSAPTARPTRGFKEDYGFEDPDEIAKEIPMTDVAELDRRSYARRTILMKSEARASHEAWVQSMDASNAACSEAQTLLRTLQAQMVALQSQQKPTGDPTHPDVPEEASSSS